MIRQAFTAEERVRLLETRRAALLEYDAKMNAAAAAARGSAPETAALDAARSHLAAAAAAERAYLDRLPRVVMSCCPFDGRPLVRTFDPHGFDGLWWQSWAAADEGPSCPHFCLVRAAIERRSGPAQGAERDEPEAHHVIPRILAMPGMVAVLSQLEMLGGDKIYVTAYFATQRPAVQLLAANWPRRQYLYTTALGQHRWRFESDEYDFDLRPWLMDRKIEWCEPGSNNELISSAPREQCPFIDLPAASAAPKPLPAPARITAGAAAG